MTALPVIYMIHLKGLNGIRAIAAFGVIITHINIWRSNFNVPNGMNSIAAAYGVGITKIKAYVDLTEPKPQFEFTFGFGATVIVDLPVVGLVSVTRSFSLTGNIDSGNFLAVAGQMLRGVLSLAGGLLVVAIQIEGKAGVARKNKADENDTKTTALFEMIFTLDVSLAFVISYDFSKSYTEEIALN